MNTRQPIQPSNQPPVLSLAFSATRSRFIAGTAEGLRCFRTDNCVTTYHPLLSSVGLAGSGIAIAEQLDDRYIAYVGGGRAPAEKPSHVIFWDAILGSKVHTLDFHEHVLGVRVNGKWMIVVLKERTIVFAYQEFEAPALPTPPPETGDEDEPPTQILKGPNFPTALYNTAPNTHALAVLRGDLLVLPAQSTGQLRFIPLQGGSKRVLRVAQSAIRQLAVSEDGTLLATASEKGTLLRVFRLDNLEQVAEFRRGSDPAIVLSLAFSPGNRWLASTSDKGTLHIFDLRPPNPDEIAAAREKAAREEKQHRKSQSYAGHRLSGTVMEKDSLSGFSGRSSPHSGPAGGVPASHQGSLQEYYSLRPVPASAVPPITGAPISAIAALKASPFAPRILKDIRSIASAPFRMGNDPPHWQGGPAHSWTFAPDGTRKRVKNAVVALPSDPSGRPPKGVLAFAPKRKDDSDDDGARLYVVGGGSDARWEMFELLPAEGGGWGLINRGFRRYLTKQFVD